MIIRIIVFVIPLFFCLPNQSYSQNDTDEINITDQPVYYSLKKAKRNKLKAYKLNLSNKRLKEFPSDIFELKELRYLILDSNQIEVIPDKIKLLEKLEVLSVAKNNIQIIPPSIGDLQHLTYLFLDFNRIEHLPRELFFLNNLNILYINDNRLKEFSTDFMKLKELRTLNVSNNTLKAIPDEIGHLYNLEKLNLSDNQLKELPDKFFELSNLTSLYLYDNQLTQINGKIEKLKKLESLGLDKNKITKLPAEIGNLYLLKNLFLGENKFEHFPYEINNLINLSILSLDSNSAIKSLPPELVHLKKLEYLYLGGITFNPFPQVLYDLQNKGVKIVGLTTQELYTDKLLLSQARNKNLIGKYPEAIEKYKQLLKSDTNNIQAMSELASTLLENGDFDSAKNICEKAMAKNPNDKLAPLIKSTYENSISRTNKLTRLNNKYEAKFQQNPFDVTPYFDLGKYYYDMKKYDSAGFYFQKAIKINPDHALSHFYLAIVCLNQKRDTSFVFSALRYLTLEPTGSKAETVLPFLFDKLKMKTGVKDKSGTTSYHDSYIIKDDDGTIIYKSDDPVVNVLVAMLSDLIRSDTSMHDIIAQTVFHTNENNVEIFQSELNNICKSYANEDTSSEKFFKFYYLPYFIDLINNGYLETLAYIINDIRKNGNGNSVAWLKNNSNKVDKFKIWTENYNWGKEQIVPNKR